MKFLNAASLKVYVGVAAVAVSIVAAGAWVYNDLQSRIQTLHQSNSSLRQAIEENKSTISQLETSIKVANTVIKNVNKDFAEVRQQNAEIRERINSLNLQESAAEDPTETEIFLTGATSRAMRCFELISGAELTEEEKNAKTAEEFNDQCPWLFDSVDD